MNEMNELETQLRSWVPRRPSPKLHQRLFAQPSTACAVAADASALLSPPAPPFRLGWLAPAFAAVLVMCMLFNQRNYPTASGATNSGPIVAMILSNQSAAAYLQAPFQRVQNRLSGESFEWTNGSGSTSSIRSLSVSKGTNL